MSTILPNMPVESQSSLQVKETRIDNVDLNISDVREAILPKLDSGTSTNPFLLVEACEKWRKVSPEIAEKSGRVVKPNVGFIKV